ncbi:hypothetical protein [Asticcacaulis sp. AC402]|uniref:DUF3024 domain-containing protein n=1 Tax=Asticcacaulis sp. AC402 TaxID=1282361 RepID=UPI0009E45DBC|nr:hypothetical protein [Asticcacaulis sp. AC402]
MAKSVKKWVSVATRPKPQKPDDSEKAAIISACEVFVTEVLKPRFLPVITPTPFNYPVDITGAWAGGRYRFLQRYRSGFAHNLGEEFDMPFARIDRMGPDNFDIYWRRHNDTWWKVHSGVTFAGALRLLETDKLLHPF